MTNIIKPPKEVSPAAEGRRSPVSVLRFGQDGQSLGGELAMDDSLPLDQSFLNEYFDCQSPLPLICDEINTQGNNFYEFGAFNLPNVRFDDLGLETWDVNDFFSEENINLGETK